MSESPDENGSAAAVGEPGPDTDAATDASDQPADDGFPAEDVAPADADQNPDLDPLDPFDVGDERPPAGDEDAQTLTDDAGDSVGPDAMAGHDESGSGGDDGGGGGPDGEQVDAPPA